MELFRNINYDFIGQKKKAFVLSGFILLLGIIFFFVHGGFNFNIDFTGGTMMEVAFGKEVDIGAVRNVVEKLKLGSPEIQTIGNSGKSIMIRFQTLEDDKKDLSLIIFKTLKDNFADKGYEIELLRSDKVGPKIGSELRSKAIWAIIFSLLAILVYVWFRFQLRFGVAALVALIHDVLITLAVFTIFDREIGLTVVAALLTIIGYSINDTIVISDRIRENMKVLFRKRFSELVNTSLNQVFSRTIITSVAVFIVVLSIFLFGGTVIKDFSLALLVGVVFGTYSSIFIVSPIVVYWEKRFPKKVLK